MIQLRFIFNHFYVTKPNFQPPIKSITNQNHSHNHNHNHHHLPQKCSVNSCSYLLLNGMAISLQTPLSSLFLILILLFFILCPSPPAQPPHLHQRSILATTTTTATTTLINYQNPIFTLPTLTLILLIHFYILIKTANAHFSTVVTTLSTLRLSPSMTAVTLLSLGNGAPELFSSLAALSSDNPRTGLATTIFAGAFVSGLVVGFIGIYASPFSVDPSSFVTDILFYLVATFFLFYVCLSGELYFWQAVGFVGFYLFFVGFVFWMDMGSRNSHHNNLDLEAPH